MWKDVIFRTIYNDAGITWCMPDKHDSMEKEDKIS